MSDDNWAICPQCKKRAFACFDQEAQRVEEILGTLPEKDRALLRSGLNPPTEEDFRTFREDYEIYGAEHGMIVLNYRGGCTNCDLELGFTYERDMELRD